MAASSKKRVWKVDKKDVEDPIPKCGFSWDTEDDHKHECILPVVHKENGPFHHMCKCGHTHVLL